MPNRGVYPLAARQSVGALILLALAVPARAQDALGTVVGCVTDITGGPAPHVTIELSIARRVYVTVFADDQGCFEAAVPSGEYVLVGKLTGFPNVTRDKLRVLPGGRLRADFKMKFPPICECLSVKPPTVQSLWNEADIVARVRITGHDRQFEYDRDPRVVHTAAVLDLWKGPGQAGNTLQFNQHPGGPRYAVGDEFVLFLVARQIVAAFEIVDGRVYGQQLKQFREYTAPVTGFLGKPLDDLLAEIGALAGK